MNDKTCPKCGGSGLLPFIKNSKVIPHTYVFCECHEDELERYMMVTPDIIDFPVSWDWHRHFCRYYEWPDPGPDSPTDNTRVEDLEDRIGNLEAISAEPGRIPRKFHDEVQQLRSQVLYLQSKIIEQKTVEKETHPETEGTKKRMGVSID